MSGKPIITEDANATIVTSSYTPQDVFKQFALQVVSGAKINVEKRLPEIAPAPALSATSTPAPTPPLALTAATLSSTSIPSTLAQLVAQLESSALFATDTASRTTAVHPSAATPATLSSAPVAAAAVPSPDRHIVNFSKHDFSSIQLRLNKEAADGYRLADFALTGYDSAEVVLERLSNPAKYDYLVVRAGPASTMEEELNKAAAEGYRLCKQTVGNFNLQWMAILERSPDAAATRYTYRLHQTVRVSSMRENIAEDQSDGYLLVASTSWAGIHLGVLEREVKPDAAKPARD